MRWLDSVRIRLAAVAAAVVLVVAVASGCSAGANFEPTPTQPQAEAEFGAFICQGRARSLEQLMPSIPPSDRQLLSEARDALAWTQANCKPDTFEMTTKADEVFKKLKALPPATPKAAPPPPGDEAFCAPANSPAYPEAIARVDAFLQTWITDGQRAANAMLVPEEQLPSTASDGLRLLGGHVVSYAPAWYKSANDFVLTVDVDLDFPNHDGGGLGEGINTLFITFTRDSADAPYTMKTATSPPIADPPLTHPLVCPAGMIDATMRRNLQQVSPTPESETPIGKVAIMHEGTPSP